MSTLFGNWETNTGGDGCTAEEYLKDITKNIYTSFTGTFKEQEQPESVIPEIKEVIYHDPATIIYWEDGTRTVVKCMKGEKFDAEKGLTMAIVKKVYGNTGCLKKWLPVEYVEEWERENKK